MNTYRTTITIGLATAALLLPAMAPATAGAQPGGGDATCHVEANNPHESKGSPGWIVGKGRISCTAAIDSLEITVQIEKNVSGNWVIAGTPGRNSVNAPQANAKYTAQGQVQCVAGEYRTAARGGGVYGGRPSKSTAWQYSGTVTNPCG